MLNSMLSFEDRWLRTPFVDPSLDSKIVPHYLKMHSADSPPCNMLMPYRVFVVSFCWMAPARGFFTSPATTQKITLNCHLESLILRDWTNKNKIKFLCRKT